MIPYRSRTSTHGRNMAGARGLWRATGMTDSDFGKPIIAVVNSFTVCISNCDKITPGMMMAALRLDIPVVFVSGGPMEAGKVDIDGELKAIDLVDAMMEAANPDRTDDEVQAIEESACPTCGSCSGMFDAFGS